MLYYILTFILGIYLDSNHAKKNISLNSIKVFRNVFVTWLYIFLCFGYMTGSDWRSYEMEYEYGMDISSDFEKGANLIFYYCSKIISDYWIFVGVFKCLYLYSIQRIAMMLTSRWLSALCIALPSFLMFMLIDNPLRFMFAMTVLNFAIPFLLQRRYLLYVIIGFISIFFHITSIIPLFLLLFGCIIPYKIFNIRSLNLIIIYIIFSLLMSNISNIAFFQNNVFTLIEDLFAHDYSEYYGAVDNSSFFTVGSLKTIIIGCILILSRKVVLTLPYGQFIIRIFIISIFLERISLIIPTGFRINIPLLIFNSTAISFIMYNGIKENFIKVKSSICFFIMFIVIAVPMALNIYNAYVYIPYSNSIPYIIGEHKTYNERYEYNLDAYKKRIGKNYH